MTMRIFNLIQSGVYSRKYRAPVNDNGDGGDGGGDKGGGDKGGAEQEVANWRDGLSDDLKGSSALADVKDIASLAQQFVDQQSYLGNAIRVPSEDASIEDKQKFYDKVQKHAPNLMPRPEAGNEEQMNAVLSALGRPDEATGYENVDVPDGITFSEDRMTAFKDMAHKHGLTKDQFNGMLKDVLGMDATAQQSMDEAVVTSRQAIEKEWGAVFKDREAQAIAAAEATGAPEAIIQMAKEGKIGGDTLKWMHSLAVKIGGGEGNFNKDDGNGSGRMTPSEAESQISDIMNNRAHPYWDSHHPENKAAIAKMLKLAAFADPSAATDFDQLRSSHTS